MTRTWVALLALLLTAGAGPSRSLPVPPIPPPNPPPARIAPLPDRDARAPSATPGWRDRVDLRNYRVPDPSNGLGYTPGSQYRTSEDKRPIQTPGFSVRVPLQ